MLHPITPLTIITTSIEVGGFTWVRVRIRARSIEVSGFTWALAFVAIPQTLVNLEAGLGV